MLVFSDTERDVLRTAIEICQRCIVGQPEAPDQFRLQKMATRALIALRDLDLLAEGVAFDVAEQQALGYPPHKLPNGDLF